jgi:hypothetical protein
MFKTLYRCPRTVARHENGPLADSRRRYLEHLAAQGAALHTIRAAAGTIYRATMMMNLDESSPVERKDVERAAERWAHRWYRNASERQTSSCHRWKQRILRSPRRCGESSRFQPAPQQSRDEEPAGGLRLLVELEFVPAPRVLFWTAARRQACQCSYSSFLSLCG